MQGQKIEDEKSSTKIAPCFVESERRRTDHIVLACTHYPLLGAAFERLAPWPVQWVDPAPAIAQRTCHVLAEQGFAPQPGIPSRRASRFFRAIRPRHRLSPRLWRQRRLAPALWPSEDKQETVHRRADAAIRSGAKRRVLIVRSLLRSRSDRGSARLPVRAAPDWRNAMGFIIWLIVGAIAGWIAGAVVRGGGFGLIGDIIVGIVGGLIAGWLFPASASISAPASSARSSTRPSARSFSSSSSG